MCTSASAFTEKNPVNRPRFLWPFKCEAQKQTEEWENGWLGDTMRENHEWWTETILLWMQSILLWMLSVDADVGTASERRLGELFGSFTCKLEVWREESCWLSKKLLYFLYSGSEFSHTDCFSIKPCYCLKTGSRVCNVGLVVTFMVPIWWIPFLSTKMRLTFVVLIGKSVIKLVQTIMPPQDEL